MVSLFLSLFYVLVLVSLANVGLLRTEMSQDVIMRKSSC